jgi:hypothetical protein
VKRVQQRPVKPEGVLKCAAETPPDIAFCHKAQAPDGSRQEAALKQLRAFEAQLLTGRSRLRLGRCA